MQEKIIQALKDKFNVSETLLKRVAKNINVANEGDIQTAVENVTFQQILDLYGDIRATEASKTAIANYEKKLAGQKSEPQPSPEPQPETIPEWAKEMMESNKQLAAQIAQMQGAKISENRKSQLEKVINSLPESLRKGYQRVEVAGYSDEDFENLLNEVKTEVDSINTDLSAKGAVFGQPKQQGHPVQPNAKATDAEVKEVLDLLNI